LLAAVVAATASAGANRPPGRIAFSLERGDVASIWTVRADGTGLREVTKPIVHQGFGGDSEPVWSHDGRRIAFSRDLPYWGSDRFRIHVVGTHGRGDAELTSGPFDVMPTWAPNRRLAFVRVVNGDTVSISSIYSVGPGAQPAKLILGSRDVTPAWSPDGKAIAFARLVDDRPRLYVADADGASVRSLGVEGAEPAWSPDGQRLAFTAASGGHTDVYTVRVDGTDLTPLTQTRADETHPTWSPDGRLVAFSRGFDRASGGDRPWLMVVGASGGPATRLTRLSGIYDPAWSPASVR
jgi:Tol biopolymer transport system component